MLEGFRWRRPAESYCTLRNAYCQILFSCHPQSYILSWQVDESAVLHSYWKGSAGRRARASVVYLRRSPCPGPGPNPGAMWHPGRPQLRAQTSHKPYAIDFLGLLCLFAHFSCLSSMFHVSFYFYFIFLLAVTYFTLTRLVSSVMQVNLFAASEFQLFTLGLHIYSLYIA